MTVSYRVIYENGKATKQSSRKSYVLPLTLAAWIGFVLFVNACWPEGQAVLARLRIPGAETTAVAFETFASELKAGSGFPQAFQMFCEEVAQGVD